VREAGPPKFEMRTISASDVGEQRQNRKILADREFRRQEAKRRRERERARRPRKTQWGVNAVDPYAEAVEAAQRAFESADQPFGLGTSERQQLQEAAEEQGLGATGPSLATTGPVSAMVPSRVVVADSQVATWLRALHPASFLDAAS
jgi:hypothetical protein